MDQPSMTPGRFLELLNKGDRTPEEESELQAELVRQAQARQAEEQANQQAEQPAPSEETPAEAPVNQQPEQPETAPVEAQAEPTEQPAEPKAENAAVEGSEFTPEQPAPDQSTYSVTQLRSETREAINFLHTQPKTMAIEMAISAFLQAEYWTSLAEGGK